MAVVCLSRRWLVCGAVTFELVVSAVFVLCGFSLFLFVYVFGFFFFSSRRRHTRCLSDWSSDVCSSDLGVNDRHHGGRVLRLLCGERGDRGGRRCGQEFASVHGEVLVGRSAGDCSTAPRGPL